MKSPTTLAFLGAVFIGVGILSLSQGWRFLLEPTEPLRKDPYLGSPIQKLDGKAIPEDLILKDVTDKKVRFNQVLSNSKWNVIHFWATWCPPCREELIALDRFRKSYEHMQVLTLSADFRWDEVKPYLFKLGLQVLSDDYIDEGGGVARRLGITKFPETLVVSPSGKMSMKLLGVQPWDDTRFVQWLNQSLEE